MVYSELCEKCKQVKKKSGLIFCSDCMEKWMEYAHNHNDYFNKIDRFIRESTKEKVEFS